MSETTEPRSRITYKSSQLLVYKKYRQSAGPPDSGDRCEIAVVEFEDNPRRQCYIIILFGADANNTRADSHTQVYNIHITLLYS